MGVQTGRIPDRTDREHPDAMQPVLAGNLNGSNVSLVSPIQGLVAKIRAGRLRALARAISIVEDHGTDSIELLKALFPYSGNAALIGVTGSPGAGKSTLFALITRLFGVQHGRIGIFGHDISREPGEALRLLGVVFQPRTLDLDLSLKQNLLYHAALHGIGRREAAERSVELLARIGLSDRTGSKVRDLSGGQMRRLEIARALLHRPRLLLLDEPTVGLDVKARADILGHVRQLVSDQGIGVLWATHLFDEITASDDLVVLHQGKMLARGRVPDVIAEAGGQDVHSAFMRLTQDAAPGGSLP